MVEPLRTKQAAVATHHPVATEAAPRMLAAGGNATDAAVTAMCTLCVIVPGSVGFAGYGGNMIAYDAATRRIRALEFNTRCPLEFDESLFATNAKKKSSIGYLAVSVPAVVSGLAKALETFGTKSWPDVTEIAIEYAENGFEVDAHNHCVLKGWHKDADDISRRAHFADGEIPNVGDRWVQRDLAKTLRCLAKHGPESFYHGEIADRIIRRIRAHGGILSLEDLKTYQPKLVEPMWINYRGNRIVSLPVPAGCMTAFQILQTLEQFDIDAFDPWSAPYLHLVAQTCKAVWPDRDLLGDPDFVKVPYDDLLAQSRAAGRAAAIRREDVQTGVEAKIDDFPHTCNVSVADRFGNFVSLTTTQGAQFGSGVVIEGTGLVLGHGMSRFEYGDPKHPNCPAPGKRPVHNMCPALIVKDDKPWAALGLPGGTRIPTVTAQLVASLVDFQSTAREAVHATRIHCEGPEPCIVSREIPQDVARKLESLGHELKYGEHALGTPIMLGGPANVVRIDESGNLDAASNASDDAAVIV